MTRYGWLVYPVWVGVIVVVSLRLVGALGMRENDRQAKDNTAQAAFLRRKLQIVEAVDLPTLEAEMQELLAILPISPATPQLLTQVAAAASSSATVVSSFRGSRDQLTVSLTAADLGAVRQFLEYLSKALPLVKATEVSYTQGTAQIVLVGGWQALPQVAATAAEPLVDPWPEITRIKNLVADFRPVMMTETDSSVATRSARVSPFEPAQ